MSDIGRGGATAAGMPAAAADDRAALQDIRLEEHRAMARALAASLGVDGMPVSVIETHISTVLVHGSEAWKLKKPVRLPFLDFSALPARAFFCAEELRLNRRLAPELYLDVVPVTGTLATPRFGAGNPVIDYAVHMRAFAQDELAHAVLARGELTPAIVDALAERIAQFHGGIPAAAAGDAYGTPAVVLKNALENFATMQPLLEGDPAALRELAAAAAWTRREFDRCAATIRSRHAQGFVRECHGDLHLGNIVVIDRVPVVFDCIEFNPEFRWIDVMSEVAFLVMDLHDRGHPELAHRFLDRWLERTGDHAGLGVLRFYVVYRAMVRAKVACLKARQLAEGPAHHLADREHHEYVALAARYARPPQPALLITHGYAGSGKSTWASRLLEHAGAVRIRTDVERKRLAGLAPEAHSGAGLHSGIYSDDATRATYQRAADLAAAAVEAGFVTIVDGTFLARWQRDLLRQRAMALAVPFAILDVTASPATLTARIRARQFDTTEVSEADRRVLQTQLERAEPLGPDEQGSAVAIDTDAMSPGGPIGPLWHEIAGRLGIAADGTNADAR